MAAAATMAVLATSARPASAQAPPIGAQYTSTTTCSVTRPFQLWTLAGSQLTVTVAGIVYCLDVPVGLIFWLVVWVPLSAYKPPEPPRCRHPGDVIREHSTPRVPGAGRQLFWGCPAHGCRFTAILPLESCSALLSCVPALVPAFRVADQHGHPGVCDSLCQHHQQRLEPDGQPGREPGQYREPKDGHVVGVSMAT